MKKKKRKRRCGSGAGGTARKGFRISGSGCWVQDFGFRISGSGFRVQDFGFRSSGSGGTVGFDQAVAVQVDSAEPVPGTMVGV